MQNVGLQTVLQMSTAAEKVQSAVQSHTALAAEDFKAAQEKADALQKEEVPVTEEMDEAKIREEDKHKKDEQKRSASGQKSQGEEFVDDEVEEVASVPVPPGASGQLLNIKV